MAVTVEGLEGRRLLAGPQVVGIHMVGTEQEVTAVVLTFSDRLDPVSSQNPDAYFVGREVVLDDVGWDPLGLRDRTRETRRIKLQSAAYDDAARTVTLTPARPFKLFDQFRRVKITGKGDNAVKDVTGQPIDGDNNGVPGGSAFVRTRIKLAKKLQFHEPDGDHVTVKLSGPGKLMSILPKNRAQPPVIFLNRTNALKTGVVGSVKRNMKTGDGIAVIGQISGVAFAAVGILTDPAFRVLVVTP